MESKIFISVSPEELSSLIRSAIKEVLPESFTNKKGRLLTRKEAAKILRISLPTLNSWTKKGTIAAVRGNSSVRYYESDIYAALESFIKYRRLP